MTKQEFLSQLRKGLSGLSQDEIEERLTFYSEMIDDRMEEGISEEEAVAEIGPADEIAAQISSDIPPAEPVPDIPPAEPVKEEIKSKRTLKAWEIVFLVLGAPIWLSLLIAAVAVVCSLYCALWSVVIALWAVDVSLIGSFLGCMVSGTVAALHGSGLAGAVAIGAGFICAGLSILLFFGCRGATKGIAFLTKKIASGIGNLFVRKENAQ